MKALVMGKWTRIVNTIEVLSVWEQQPLGCFINSETFSPSNHEGRIKMSSRYMPVVRIIGRLLSIVAIVFVILQLSKISLDVKIIFSLKSIFVILIQIVIVMGQIFLGCYGWLKFVEILSGSTVGFKAAMLTYTKSNIYKYVPGNIFQFIARNELASKCGIGNLDVAAATIMDTAVSLAVALLIAICCLGQTALQYMIEIWFNYRTLFFSLMVVGLVALCLTIMILKSRMFILMQRFIGKLTKPNICKFLQAIGYYVLNNLVSSITMFLFVSIVFEISQTPQMLITLSGAYILSAIIGVVTPGAPGGIGVREAVMIVLTGNMLNRNIIITTLVLLRIAAIVGDVIVFLIRSTYEAIIKRKGDVHLYG